MNKPKPKGKYDKRSPRIDFSTWNLHTAESVQDSVEELTRNILKEAFTIATTEEGYECMATFKISAWGGSGRKNADPDVIEVSLPIGAVEFEEPTWEFSLSELVGGAVEAVERGPGGPIIGPDRRGLALLANHLRAQADLVENALNRAGGEDATEE